MNFPSALKPRHVLERIRAGVLEADTVALLREVGLGERMDREGHPHASVTVTGGRFGRTRACCDNAAADAKSLDPYSSGTVVVKTNERALYNVSNRRCRW